METELKLIPSSADRNFVCGASFKPPLKKQKPINKYAEYGNDFHRIVELSYHNWDKKSEFKIAPIKKIPKELRDFLFENKEYIEGYINTIHLICDNFENANIEIEKKIAGQIELFDIKGKVDCLITIKKTAIIIDLKTSFIKYSPEKSKQLMLYAYLLYKQGYEEVTIAVYQPFVFRKLSAVNMNFKEVEKQVKDGIKTIQKGKEVVGDHCKYCPHHLTCKTLKDKYKNLNIEKMTKDITNTELSKLFDNYKAIEGFLDSLKSEIKERLENGQDIKGYELLNKNGKRQWIDILQAERELSHLGQKIYETKILSPARVEKVAGKKNIEHLTVQPLIKQIGKKD